MPAREADACAPFAPFANLRTKNRSRWQIFTFRGRRSWRRSRCRLACFPLCLVTALGCCAALLRALVWSAQATSNRQNLPAGAVFRAQAPLWGQGREVGAARERETGVWRRGSAKRERETGAHSANEVGDRRRAGSVRAAEPEEPARTGRGRERWAGWQRACVSPVPRRVPFPRPARRPPGLDPHVSQCVRIVLLG